METVVVKVFSKLKLVEIYSKLEEPTTHKLKILL